MTDLLRRLLGLPSKPKPPVDYGDGLYRLPEQALDRDDDTGLLIPEWATQEWAIWQSLAGPADNRHECPACVMVGRIETYRYMARAHSDRAARRRWSRNLAKGEAKLHARGPCRCGHRINPGQAAADTRRELSRYQL